MQLKECKRCKQELPLDQFYTSKYTKDGYRSYCKECDKECNNVYYKQNAEKVRKKVKEYADSHKDKIKEHHKLYYQLHKEERKEYLKQLFHDKRDIINCLKSPCAKCGEERPWIIAFHHIDPEQKSFTIGDRFRGDNAILEEEIKKCICMCMNCHAEFHWIYGVKPENPIEALYEYLDDNFVYNYRESILSEVN